MDKTSSASSSKIRLILVDDHTQIHFAISSMLAEHDLIELVAQGSNGIEAVQLCALHKPDILLMDIMMPQMDGITAAREIHEINPEIKILALSGFQDKDSVQAMLTAGAIGYVLKTTTSEDLISAIYTAYNGQSVMSLEVMQTLLEKQLGVAPEKDARQDYGLTSREIDVLRHLVGGSTNNEIAEAMIISLSTVKFHLSNIFQKLHVSTRTEAVSLALEEQLI